MAKQILVTGGAGFIGSALCLALVEQGYSVTVLDNLSPQIHGEQAEYSSELYLRIKDKVQFIKGSVTNYALLKAAVQEQDAIIHLAAETGTGQSMYQISHYYEVNTLGTAHLLDILANHSHSVNKIIVASSRAIYGEGKYCNSAGQFFYPLHRQEDRLKKGDFELYNEAGEALCAVATDEESNIHPSSVYGITKQNQEQLILNIAPRLGINAIALRYQNVYGPGQSLKNPYTGILSIFSNLIRSGQGINIFEDGLESRDFVYIDDVVAATMLSLTYSAPFGQVFNVGTGIPTTVLSIARALMKNYAIEVPLYISGNYRLGDIRHNYADLTKIRTLLGFEPKINLENGLQNFTQWVSQQAIAENQYEQSLAIMKQKGLLK